jgi:hypothetical protein
LTMPSLKIIDSLSLLQVMFRPLLVAVAKCRFPRTSSRFVIAKDSRSVEQVLFWVALAIKAKAEVARTCGERMVNETEIDSWRHIGIRPTL